MSNQELRKLFHRNYGSQSILEVNLNLAKSLNLEMAGLLCYCIDLEKVTKSLGNDWYVLSKARLSSKFNIDPTRLDQILEELLLKNLMGIKKNGPHLICKLNYEKLFELMYPEFHDDFDYSIQGE